MLSSPQGLSTNWWNYWHFQHHVKPNIYPKDPDIDIGPLFVIGDLQPVKVGLKILGTGEFSWKRFLERSTTLSWGDQAGGSHSSLFSEHLFF